MVEDDMFFWHILVEVSVWFTIILNNQCLAEIWYLAVAIINEYLLHE